MRSSGVLRIAPDSFFTAYNDVAYGGTPAYDPSSAAFHARLFEWEERAVSEWFPAPPARVLVCGAGGGREAGALACRGYRVTAFDPAERLVRASEESGWGRAVESVYCGSYAQLPILRTTRGEPVDLSEGRRFEAAVLGWASLSHLRGDEACVSAMAAVARLTTGPILVSFFGRDDQTDGPGEVFSAAIGYYRQFSGEEIGGLVARARLRLLSLDTRGRWPHMVLAPGEDVSATESNRG